MICPTVTGDEAAWVGAIPILAPPDLVPLINHFKGNQVLSPPQPGAIADTSPSLYLRDIKGQETAKRALEVAAGGGHNVIMVASPGAGKSILAQRMAGLLPPIAPEAALEVSMIHSVAGLLDSEQMAQQRLFRDPHHSASLPALVGGGV